MDDQREEPDHYDEDEKHRIVVGILGPNDDGVEADEWLDDGEYDH